MTSIKHIGTLAVAITLLFTPMIASASAGMAKQAGGLGARTDDASALLCEARAAQNDMLFLRCLAGCAQRLATPSSHDERCEAACIDKRGAREERVRCDPSQDDHGSDDLATAQAAPRRKLSPAERQDCYWVCRKGGGGLSIPACEKSCF